VWQSTRMPWSARPSPPERAGGPLALSAVVLMALCARPGYCSGIAVNGVTNKIFVPVPGDVLDIIDGVTNTDSPVEGVLGGSSVAINPVTNRIYVSNGPYSGIISPLQVTVVDGASRTVAAIVSGAAGPIAVNPVTNRIYVSSPSSVTVIDGTSNASTALAVASGGPIAVNPATNKVYVSTGFFSAVAGPPTVTVIDGATGAATALTGIAGPIAVNEVTNKVYVANTGHNEVIALDGATNATTAIPLVSNPYSIALNPVTNRIYVASFEGDNVTVIDGATNATTVIPAGSSPQDVEVNPVTNTTYVLDTGNVTVIDGATNATSTAAAGDNPAAMAVNLVTGRVYVKDDASVDVTVIDGASGPPAAPTARLTNISVRAQVGTGGNVLIPGFVISGSGTETLLIRGAGPALAQFGVPGPLAKPVLSLFDGSGAMVASNAGWGTGPDPLQLSATAAQVGAFAFSPGGADCALLASLPAGSYTVRISGMGGTTGVALAEVYEVSSTGTRLANISSRALVGAGANVVIPGFVISGNGTKELLVRADGPSLAQYGIAGVLAHPSLGLFDGAGVMIAADTGWAAAGIDLISGFDAELGAFPLVPGSDDSAQVVDLPPGNYTMQVSGAGGSTGVALAEVYEVP